jgi:hypothetical protein
VNPYLDRWSTNSDVKQGTKYASSVHFPVNTFLLGSCSNKIFFEKLVNSRDLVSQKEVRADHASPSRWVPYTHFACLTRCAMTHIAIQEGLKGKVADWMEKVSDEQYTHGKL